MRRMGQLHVRNILFISIGSSLPPTPKQHVQTRRITTEPSLRRELAIHNINERTICQKNVREE